MKYDYANWEQVNMRISRMLKLARTLASLVTEINLFITGRYFEDTEAKTY
jgi:hypothetical protein